MPSRAHCTRASGISLVDAASQRRGPACSLQIAMNLKKLHAIHAGYVSAMLSTGHVQRKGCSEQPVGTSAMLRRV